MIKIRKITTDDLEILAKLNASIFKDTSEKHALWVFNHSLENGVPDACLVAEENGEIIGAVFAEEKKTFYPDSSHIKSIFVKEKWQGKGIGRQLIEKCLDALEKAGMKNVSLSVDPKNRSAVSMYEKFDFKKFRVLYLKKF
jgi:ribosomal protein S18 acetylase RimI-like enzyme